MLGFPTSLASFVSPSRAIIHNKCTHAHASIAYRGNRAGGRAGEREIPCRSLSLNPFQSTSTT
jgi:hypothetical protein